MFSYPALSLLKASQVYLDKKKLKDKVLIGKIVTNTFKSGVGKYTRGYRFRFKGK